MKMTQIWAATGGFFLVYILITLTNRPAVHSHETDAARGAANGGQRQQTPVAAQGNGRSQAQTIALAPGFMRGMVLTCPGVTALSDSGADEAITSIAGASANWVAINLPLGQESGTSTDVSADPVVTPTESSVAHAVDLAHRQQLRVMLRPVIVAKDGTAREDFAPADPKKWLDSYASTLDPYLDMARVHNVELIDVGSDYSRTEATAPWPELIARARRGYTGAVTYGAAAAAGAGGGGYQVVPFWSQLDYVGIDAFFPISQAPNPTMADCQQGWKAVSDEIKTWMPTGAAGKPVLFTAIGMPACAGAAARPGHVDAGAAEDNDIQNVDCQAFLSVMGAQSWLSGAFWYGWEVRGAGEAAGPYAIQGRPAATTLRTAYAAATSGR